MCFWWCEVVDHNAAHELFGFGGRVGQGIAGQAEDVLLGFRHERGVVGQVVAVALRDDAGGLEAVLPVGAEHVVAQLVQAFELVLEAEVLAVQVGEALSLDRGGAELDVVVDDLAEPVLDLIDRLGIPIDQTQTVGDRLADRCGVLGEHRVHLGEQRFASVGLRVQVDVVDVDRCAGSGVFIDEVADALLLGGLDGVAAEHGDDAVLGVELIEDGPALFGQAVAARRGQVEADPGACIR